MRKILSPMCNTVYAQDLCKIVLFSQCAIYAQDLRKIVLLSPICNILYAQDCTSFSNAQDSHKIVLLSPMDNICARLYFSPQCAIYVQDCTYLPSVPDPLTIYAQNIIIQQVIKFSIFLFKLTGQTTYNKEKKNQIRCDFSNY